MFRYAMISKSEESPTERPLAVLTGEAVAIRLQTDHEPQIFFIKEDVNGYIEYPFRINGYCSHDGKYIAIRHGLTPKAIVATTIHEMRHAYQCQDAKRHKLSVEMRERDAELFVYEFFGSHSNNGDAASLTRTLNQILQDDLDRLWKQALVSARAPLSAETDNRIPRAEKGIKFPFESSDELRRRFEPVLKARSLAVQRFLDPNNSRQLFPDNIEFSCPRSTTLKVSY